MAPRRCCCGGCEIGRDEFNRANAATLGGGWSDPDTAWSIDSNEALSTAAGAARFLTVHPVPSTSMVVYFTTKSEVNLSGTKYRVCCNMVDEDNYHYVEFERQGASDSVLRLGKVSAGVGTVLEQDTIVGLTGTTREVIARISAREFCGFATNSTLSFVGTKPSIITNGHYAGIEALASGMRIDDFIFEQHRETLDPCNFCLCKCETEYIPPVLLATFAGTGRMTSIDGAELLLYWDRLNAQWRSSATSLCTPGETWQLHLSCPTDENDGSTARLTIFQGCTDTDGIGTSARTPASYTCDPIEWVFGPYDVTSTDLTCGCGSPFGDPGTYTITITEQP